MKIQFYFLIALTMTITSFQTSNPRRLLLFGEDGITLQSQLQLLARDSTGLSERDVKIERLSFDNTMARKYSVNNKNQLTVILIGRDGGEKYRTHTPVSTQTLFDIIDSMPMRQSEMREKSN